MLLLAGLLVGAVAAMVQSVTTQVGGVTLPTGAVLSLLAIVPMARAGAWWADSRAGAVAFSLGWLIATLAMGAPTPSGDLVLTSGTRQVSYLVGGSLLLAAACGFPLLPEDGPGERVVDDAAHDA
jgi:hypothetical protein